MNIEKCIKTGDRVKIIISGGIYNTIVEGILDETEFYLSPPQKQQYMLMPKQDQVCTVRSTDKRGFVEFDVRILGIERSDNIPLIKAAAISEPVRVQRRNSYRAEVMLGVVVRRLAKADEDEPAEEKAPYITKTLNISEDGMLFFSDGQYRIGEKVECDIRLDRFDTDEVLEGIKAQITRRDDTEDGRHRTAVRFTDYPNQYRNLLLRFIAQSQRRKSGGNDRSP
jgi:c-di-GMP-binding flagellar brake protein YcgR